MADHVYKPSEVPKGQRWQHFLDYYKLPFIFAVIAIFAVISILKATVFSPKPDVAIIFATEFYVDSEMLEEIKTTAETLSFDINKDGKTLIDLDSVQLSETMMKSDPEAYSAYQTKLIASLSTAASALQIVDESMYLYLDSEGLVGTYAELPNTFGHAADEKIKIPLETLAPFSQIEGLPEGLFMTLRPEDAMQIRGSEAKAEKFRKQIDLLMTMIES